MSEIPTPASPHSPLKTYGQDYRYAETLQNPFPEVVVCSSAANTPHTAPTLVAAVAVGGDGTTAEHATRSSHRPDTARSKEPLMPEDIRVEPREAPWYKTISRRKWAAIIICTIGITGVVLAILGAMNKLSGKRSAATTTDSLIFADMTSSSDSSSPINDNTSTTGTISATSTTTSANPKSTVSPLPPPLPPPPSLLTPLPPNPQNNPPPPKTDCTTPTTFLHPITWVGTDVGTYKGEFSQATSPETCCKACVAHAAGGCAGWLYNATSLYTPCTKIILTVEQEGDRDERSTMGHAPVTYFSKGEVGKGEVAGMGPCGVRFVVQD
jgi:hypothetical protein